MSQFDPDFKIGNMEEIYLPVVVGSAVVGDRVLRLLFSDGTVGDVDFSAGRWSGVLEPLSDPAYFAAGTPEVRCRHAVILPGDRTSFQVGCPCYGGSSPPDQVTVKV